MNALRLWSAATVMGCAVSAAWARDTTAEPVPPPVVVDLEHCEEPLAAEVRRIVGVELRATVVDASQVRGAATQVLASCRGAEVGLVVKDGATGKRLERAVELAAAAPAARARLVALAAAELVVTSRQEIEEAPAPSIEATPPPPPAQVQRVARAKQVSAMAEAIGAVRAFPGSALWLLGAGARGFFTISRPFTLTLEVTAAWGKASRTTGQVAGRAISGGLGLGWGIERKWAFIMPWVGARAGVASLTGEPGPGSQASGRTQSGPCLGPELGASVTLFPHAPAHVTVTLSAGVMLLGVRGEVTGDRNVDVQGPWAALVVGVGATKL